MTNCQLMMLTIALAVGGACSNEFRRTADGSPRISATADEVKVVFKGGHETNPVDQGRPVALLGPALGVTPEIFRQAFSGVTPARGGHPSPAEARANKQALMSVLAPHGIANDRLDEVSDFYRYQPQDGGLWRHEEAAAAAIVEGGMVKGFRITNPGYGYTTAPAVTVPGYPDLPVKATVEFGPDVKQNGRLIRLEIVAEK